jgi:hypothetical protein
MSLFSSSEMKGKMTRFAFLWMSLSSEPFVALYALLPFILAKDLNADPIQISLFLMIKPTVSVLAYFWDSWIKYHHSDCKKHLMLAWGLSFTPFLFYPFLSSWGYILFAAGAYQLFNNAAKPPFFEIFKQNLDVKVRQRLVSNTFIFLFIISAISGVIFGKILDVNAGYWKPISAIFSLLALTSLLVQKRLTYSQGIHFNGDKSSSNFIIKPIEQSIAILKSSKEFRDFQVGFMLGGSALMLILPALTIFYADILKLTHQSYTSARYIFMALGIIVSTPLWKKAIAISSLNQLMPWISLFFGLFPLVVLLSFLHTSILYAAFAFYGIAQAGSHVIWNISGTIFSKDKDSTPFTAINILTQGIRGLFAPLLGGLLTNLFGAPIVLVIGSIFAFFGMFMMFKNNQKAQAMK